MLGQEVSSSVRMSEERFGELIITVLMTQRLRWEDKDKRLSTQETALFSTFSTFSSFPCLGHAFYQELVNKHFGSKLKTNLLNIG